MNIYFAKVLIFIDKNTFIVFLPVLMNSNEKETKILEKH